MERENLPILVNNSEKFSLAKNSLYTASVQDALRNPITGGHTFVALLCEGKPNPAWGIILNGFTIDQARELIDTIKVELRELRNDQPSVKLFPEIDASVNGENPEEDHFIHELRHIEMAEKLGVNLGACTLQFYAEERIISGTLGIQIFFTFPPDLDPMTAAKICLAPEWLSLTDVGALTHIIKVNRDFFLKNLQLVEQLEIILRRKNIGINNDGEKPKSLKEFL